MIQTSEGNGWVSAKYAQLHGTKPQSPATQAPNSSTDTDSCSAPASKMNGVTHGRSTLGGNPLNVRNSPGGTKIDSLSNGEEFDILAGPVCAGSRLFWHIRNGRIDAWVMEGDGTNQYIEPWGQTAPQQETYMDEISCNDGSVAWATSSHMLSRPHTQTSKYWCTEYVATQYPRLIKCWGGYRDAHIWADWARNPSLTNSKKDCGLTVDPTQSEGGSFNWNNIRSGDIVVWDQWCGPSLDKGHVGIVVSVELYPKKQPQARDRVQGPVKANILVNEANGRGDKTVEYEVLHGVYGCMSFIHVPSNLQGR